MKKLINIFAIVSLLTVAAPALSQGNLQDALENVRGVAQQSGVDTEQDVGSTVGRAINVALQLVGLIFLVLTVYAGFLWMTARGNDEQVLKARKILIGSVIGLAIAVSAYAITALVTGRFLS